MPAMDPLLGRLHAMTVRHRRPAAPRRQRRWLALGLLCWLGQALAQTPALPPEVSAALRRARLPESALSVVLQEAGSGQRLLAWNEQVPVNPASVFKLVTTYAALDLLGPAWTWSTPVSASGPLRDGVLDGTVTLRGSGDPKLVIERLWLLLRRLQQLGVREIRGDILLDRSAFKPADGAAGDFDGEAGRPYNVRPDALLLNYKSINLSFTPEPARGLVRISAEPALAGLTVDSSVALAEGPCLDWRTALKADTSDADKLRLLGRYPASCGAQTWPLAYVDPGSYNARLVAQVWRELGGALLGKVRDGTAPAGSRPLFEFSSPPLADVVREINKYSNNVMAEQLLLSLALAGQGGIGPVGLAEGREVLRRWLLARLGEETLQGIVIDNGSGLSRDTRIPALALARLLQQAWSSPVMSELMSSLPVNGVDGTLKHSASTAGRAHLKTGSLRDVSALAGYVLSNSGRRYVLVAVVNHPLAAASRPALDALIQWSIADAPAR